MRLSGLHGSTNKRDETGQEKQTIEHTVVWDTKFYNIHLIPFVFVSCLPTV